VGSPQQPLFNGSWNHEEESDRANQQIVATLPEIVDVNDQIERLHLLDKIEQAEKHLARGEGVPHETSKQRLSLWLQ
jgi:hypothetical protein